MSRSSWPQPPQKSRDFRELLQQLADEHEAVLEENGRLRTQVILASLPATLPTSGPSSGSNSPRGNAGSDSPRGNAASDSPRGNAASDHAYIGQVTALEMEAPALPPQPLPGAVPCPGLEWSEADSVYGMSSAPSLVTPGSLVTPAPTPVGLRKSLTTSSFFVRRSVFEDAEAMKEELRRAVSRKTTKSTTGKALYKEQGMIQRVARSSGFEYAAYVMIALNAIWIAVDTDYNDADLLLEADAIFQIMENVFCLFFTVEWVVRFLALRRKREGLADAWLIFDFVLMFTMVLETWGMTLVAAIAGGSSFSAFGDVSLLRLFRLLRLSRLSRMARLVRLMPELLCMLRAMVQAVRSVAYTLGLLMSIIYVFSILLKQLSTGTPVGEQYFPTVAESVYTLLLHGTLLDNVGQVLNELRSSSAWVAIAFALVVFLAALTLMNMLVGVLVEVMSSVAATEREQIAVAFVKDRVQAILKDLDGNNDGSITRREFEGILQNHKAAEALKEVGVDPVALVDFAELIFQSDACGKEFEKNLDFNEFMDLALQLRGSKGATVRDIVDLRKFIQTDNSSLNLRLARLEERLKRIGCLLDVDGAPDCSALTSCRTSRCHSRRGSGSVVQIAVTPSPLPGGW